DRAELVVHPQFDEVVALCGLTRDHRHRLRRGGDRLVKAHDAAVAAFGYDTAASSIDARLALGPVAALLGDNVVYLVAVGAERVDRRHAISGIEAQLAFDVLTVVIFREVLIDAVDQPKVDVAIDDTRH